MSAADTIYALASAPGRAAVALLRLSGPLALPLCAQLCGQVPPARQATLATLRHNGEALDRALILSFPAPASYTGEDVVELHLHGGRAVLHSIIMALQQLGARPAEPGEFTRRAVSHGKMDLTAAEGVADLIDAQTSAQRRAALRQQGGALAKQAQAWAQRLTRAHAHLAAAIDFADDDLPAGLQESITQELVTLAQELNQLLTSAPAGERLREGVFAAIIGAPNAGKSTLLNALAQRDIAIVTPQAGTTRDVLEVPLELAGYPLTLADTAGLREAQDIAEREGIARARRAAAQADLRVLLFASTDELADIETLALYQPGDVVVLSKSDLGVNETLRAQLPVDALTLSVTTGSGLDALLARLSARLEDLAGLSATPALTRARHTQAISACAAALHSAVHAPTLDLLAEEVRTASRALGRLTGEVDTEQLLDIIFRDFCLGK